MTGGGKDYRYEVAKLLLETGRIKTFPEIFTRVPKTVVARDLGMNHYGVGAFIDNPGKYRLEKLLQLAALIDVSPEKVVALAIMQATAPKTKTTTRGRRPGLKFTVETTRK